MVRPPGFGPGSTAWKADVLDQTRLRSPETVEHLSSEKQYHKYFAKVEERRKTVNATFKN